MNWKFPTLTIIDIKFINGVLKIKTFSNRASV